MLSTIHRRHILALLEKEKTVSLKKLKEVFVESHEMNQTTLYRILERFVMEGVLHKAEFTSEKFYTLCLCGKKEEAIKLTCCMNCHSIEENHSPLPTDSFKSETVELVKLCTHCKNL